jgi:hypothetical protein
LKKLEQSATEEQLFSHNKEILHAKYLLEQKSDDWWQPDTITITNADADGLVEFDKREIYTYDDNGNIKCKTVEEFYNEWFPVNRIIYSYKKNEIFEDQEEWDYDEQSWVLTDKFKITYNYDTKNNLLSITKVKWFDSAWNPWTKYEYTYDENNHMLSEADYFWGDSWIQTYMAEYTYDNEGNKQSMIESYYHSLHKKYTYTYINNILSTEIIQMWDAESSNWYYEEKNVYTSNANNDTIVKTSSEWNYDYNDWKEVRRKKQIYNQHKMEIFFESFSFYELWEAKEIHIYMYDDTGNQVSLTLKSWFNEQWVDYFKTENTYDEHNNATEVANYDFIDGKSWKAENSDCSFYYNNMQSVSSEYYYIHKINISYTKTKKLNISETKNDNLLCYPNPTKDQLKLEGLIGNEIISICDVSGKKVFITHTKNTFEVIDISHLHQGMYFINVSSNDKTICRKIIKE